MVAWCGRRVLSSRWRDTVFEDVIGSMASFPTPPDPYIFDVGDYVDGDYRVLSLIGQGGMGAVLRVKHWLTEEEFALKYCKVTGIGERRFAREVRAMMATRHPHVIEILDSNLEHEPPYFLMPVAEKSLEEDLP